MTTPTTEKHIKDKDINTTKQYLRQVWQGISKSTDQLFFIRIYEEGRLTAEWHLIQIDLDKQIT
jgi:hypothetical protein